MHIVARQAIRCGDQHALEGGKGTMADFIYVDGAAVLPSDAEVKKLRPARAD